MKIKKSKLRRIISEQVEDAIATIEVPNMFTTALVPYLASLRALQLWFHSAHNLTKGTGFAGDHTELYGKIYVELQDNYDAAVEKAIGLSGDEQVACPVLITGGALEVLGQHMSPSGASSLDIAKAALGLLNAHVELLTYTFYSLEDGGTLPLGLNDFLMSSANDYETYMYMLQQRVKE